MRQQGLMITLITLITLIWMTKNGLWITYACFKCGGAARHYRTVERHAALAAADHPLLPALRERKVTDMN